MHSHRTGVVWLGFHGRSSLLLGSPRHRVLELAPVSWQRTLEDDKTQQRLGANIFRQATFAPVGDHHGTG